MPKYRSTDQATGSSYLRAFGKATVVVLMKAAWTIIFLQFSSQTNGSTLEHVTLINFEILSSIGLIALLYFWVMRPLTEDQPMVKIPLLKGRTEYQKIFNRAGMGVAHVDLSGRWIMVNQHLCELTGYTEKELSKLRFQDITHPDDLENDLRHVQNLVDGNTSSRKTEKRYVCKNGDILWANLNLTLVRKPSGEPDFFIAIVEDITHRRKTEKTVELLGRILEDSLNEVYVFDAESFKFTSVNYGARTNLGYTIEELEQMTPLNLKPEFTHQSFAKMVQPLIDGTEEKIIFHTYHGRKDGTIYPVEVHLQYFAKEDPPVFIAVILDTSERERMNEDLNKMVTKLEKANAAKSEFLANMSHELRTPLNAIIGFSEVIGNQSLGNVGFEKYIEYAHDIENSGRYLLDLINDILDLSKIEAGRYTLDCEQLDVSEVISTALALLKQRAEDKGVQLTADEADPALRLWADKRAIKQVLINLLGNAVKFTDKGGTIAVSTSHEGDIYKIRVIDDGNGIPKEKLKDLTQRFVTAHDGNLEDTESTGLGLSISTALVSLHEGQMDIQSTEGEGTQVTVTLPMQPSKV